MRRQVMRLILQLQLGAGTRFHAPLGLSLT
jgi:hypothetical protein